jgi:hypothetical protein
MAAVCEIPTPCSRNPQNIPCSDCMHPCETYDFFQTNPYCMDCEKLSLKCLDGKCENVDE